MAVRADQQIDALLEQIRGFMRDEVYPLEAQLLREGFGALLPTLREKRRLVKQLGLWAPHLPQEYGGLGLSLSEFGRVSEILGTSPLGHFLF
ncbi:MAG: acyl-CoA dehydrogenase family protein, partial [Chloroflexi bacterium]|nr:acyl-CoA dehydrogenase family protein [Chloroflexota bacterium]